jgi:2-polyprenyl-3-methyl-5-hydroxy-6-metoxy-1,4-benzoquinol methylase
VFTTTAGVRVVQCICCDIQFAEAYPEIEEADTAIYGDSYFADAKEERRSRERIFSELLGDVEYVLGRKGRLLDVGCGEGLLLEVAAELGWRALGTEISSAMIRYARDERGLEVHDGVLEGVSLPLGSFDAVVLNHVLEHVKNPRTTLSRVRDLLTEDGIVRIEVPNLAGFSSRVRDFQSRHHLKKNPWKHYSTDHHFWYFTPQTLMTTIETAGLSVLSIDAPAVQWGKKGIFARAANKIYERTFWGRHIVAFARRRRP